MIDGGLEAAVMTHSISLKVAREQRWAAARMKGRLVRSPFCGRPYEAELKMWPLRRPHEYASIATFENACETPILVSPSQRDRWLVEVLRAAREHIPLITLIVVRMGGPQAQLPAELLDESVFLTHEPAPSITRVLASGQTDVMEVWHDIRTDGIDEGDNRVVITVFGPRSVPGFIEFVGAAAPLAALEISSIDPIEAA